MCVFFHVKAGMRLWKCMCARVQVVGGCMRTREHWGGLSVFWRLSDWACHSGTGKVSSAQASEPEPISQPDLNPWWADSRHSTGLSQASQRAKAPATSHLPVCLTDYGIHLIQWTSTTNCGPLWVFQVSVCLSVCVCVCVCVGSYLIWVLTSEFQGAPKPQNASFTNMSKLILIICTNKKVFGCTNCTNAIGSVNKI